MPLRVNPILLLSIIIVLILSFWIFASASGGGTAGDAVSVGMSQMGKPFVMSTDGPNTFSCSGLMRYIMRTIGVDGDAPWVPEGYLGKYAPVDPANMQPGDIVIYPNWATMYVGNGMVLNANEDLGKVTETPMSVAGVPEGVVRPPYGGQQVPPSGATDPTPGAPVTGPTTTTAPTTAANPPAGQDQVQADPMPLTTQAAQGDAADSLPPPPPPSEVPQAAPSDAVRPTSDPATDPLPQSPASDVPQAPSGVTDQTVAPPPSSATNLPT
jgi:peptidoglycan DL-endopeptidase CwlO